jgi:hypothetical protein
VNARYEFIDAEKATTDEHGLRKYTVVLMCEWMEVSTSGFYDWLVRPMSATAARREQLKLLVTKAFEDSDETYGYRRVHAQLARWGEVCTPELVRGLMRELGAGGLPAAAVAGQPDRVGPVRADPGPGGA